MGWLFIAIGLFSLLGGAFGWSFFMQNRRAQMMSSLLGETGARVFYCLLGLAIAGFGVAGVLGAVPMR